MSLALIQADCKSVLSTLTNLNNDELDSILNDEDKVQEIFDKVEQNYLKDIENEKETMLASNSSLVEFNIAREPELVEGRRRIEELSTQGEEVYKSVEEKTGKIRESSSNQSLETTLALLQTAASEMEEESDAWAQKFLDSEVELDDFLDEFLTKRKLMHMRLVKAEKMAKILSRDPSLSDIPTYANPPPVNLNSNYFPSINPAPASSVPYPLGPMAMPMPGSMNYFSNHY